MRAREPLLAQRPHRTARAPVVRRSSGHCDDAHIRTLAHRPPHLRRQLARAGGWRGGRQPGHATGVQTRSVAVIRRHGGTAHLLRACRATGRLALGHRLRPLGVACARWPRPHHPVERHGHGDRLGGDRLGLAQRRCTPQTLGLPVGTAWCGPPLQCPGGRRPGAPPRQPCFALLWRQLRHDPGRLLCGQWRPRALQDPRTQVQGAYGTGTGRLLPGHAPRDTERSRRTVGRGCTAQDAMRARPCRLQSRPIKLTTTSCTTQRCALSRHTETRPLLGTGLKGLDGLGGGAALTQQSLELIHGARVTGPQGPALQCVPGDSPLAEVM